MGKLLRDKFYYRETWDFLLKILMKNWEREGVRKARKGRGRETPGLLIKNNLNY